MPTPRVSSPKVHTAAVQTTIAIAGAAFATMSAGRSPRPKRTISGLRPRFAHSRKSTAAMPMAAVTGFTPPRWGSSDSRISSRLSPCVLMPSSGPICPAAICTAAAVMNPETTGWLRKLARKPSRSKPMAIIRIPVSSAMATAAPMCSGVPAAATCAAAAPVIRLATATGPTASAREVPKTA